LFQEGRGDGIVCAPGELGDEINAFRVDGATSADSENDKAHVGIDVAVLVAARVSSDGKVGSEA